MEKNETEVFLQWGSRKRLRCVRVRGPPIMDDRSRRKISSSRFFTTIAKDNNTLFPRLTRNSESAMHRKASSGSPEKEERCYTTRDNSKIPPVDNQSGCCDNNNNNNNNNNNKRVWPKLYVSLSSKEKEEDFMAMKGCKLPQRPKKRAKLIQRTLLLVSPGAWLTDMSIERYEVREKKTSKKRARGLKAMGSVESDSE